MSSQSRQQRLLRATAEAQARRAKARAGLERRQESPPQPGDVFAFAATAAHAVLWVVLDSGAPGDGRRHLLVAADLHPSVGSTDVAVPAEAAGGAMSLRCSFEVRLAAADFAAAKRTNCLDAEILAQARRKRAQVEAGTVTGSALERDTDGEPEYLDWLEEGPAEAQAALASSRQPFAQSRHEAGEPADDRIYAGGVDGASGDYLLPAVDTSQVAAWARSEDVPTDVLHLLQHVHRVASQPHLGLSAGVDAGDLSQTGWAIVFHEDESQAVRDALATLVDHRRAQAGTAKTRILTYRPGDRWRRWLSRHGVAAGRVRPAKLPYYLLLVGSPAKIPYEFETVLGVEYATGRLSFETPDEYRRYAESVVEHETRQRAPQTEKAVFFAPRHPGDPITRWSADHLVKPLMDGLPSGGTPGVAERQGFATARLWGEDATKAHLIAALHPPDDEPPALLFGAAHGLGWPEDHPHQRALQGALLCQGWTAGESTDAARHGFAAVDVDDEARVHGTVAWLHGSFSAGTPEQDRDLPAPATSTAREPFVAALPQRLLAHPRGGALAVIGLIDRVWGPAALPDDHLRALEDTLEGVLTDVPVGHAVKTLKKRYAAASNQLEAMRKKMSRGARLDAREIAAVWSARNDTRGTVVVGDPAARLRRGSTE